MGTPNRNIVAELPPPGDDQSPVTWTRAYGYQVEDDLGNTYIDLSAGGMVTGVGHSHPRVLDAMRSQIDQELTYTFWWPSKIRDRLERRLELFHPAEMGKVELYNTGTEATEAAMRLMRLFRDRQTILMIEPAHHGWLEYRWMSPSHDYHMLPLPAGDSDDEFPRAIDKVQPESIAGIVYEPIPGYTTRKYPEAYIRQMYEWAHKHGIPICADEVQAGLGRTGRVWSHQHYEVDAPDLLCIGKTIGNGAPIAAVKGVPDIMAGADSLKGTYSGNPLCCAAALAVLDVLAEDDLVMRAARIGVQIAAMVAEICVVHGDVIAWGDGFGFFHSIHLHDPALCDAIVLECARRGVLLCRTGPRGYLKITPPLTIPEDALREAMQVIGEVFETCVTT